ncbi:MAG TPA: carboxyl transferase domain-containing protein, partial [Planctomycetota bacterium]|nr:carboxyl transferase domain-containing protein [Planctomycetota bacterium]
MSLKIRSKVQTGSADFRANDAFHRGLARELREHLGRVQRGGSDKAVERHRARNKLLPRERIGRVLDPGSPFIELSPLAAHDLYGGEAPSASIVTRIGRVHRRETMFVANDAT